MSAEPTLKIVDDKAKLARILAEDFSRHLTFLLESKEIVYLALSGGSTPVLFFRELVKMKPSVHWDSVRIFWVDDRCVAPDDPESNYGVARKEFLDPLEIPEHSVFRIRGEDNPHAEAERYGNLIMDEVSPEMTFPVFDMVFLGMGNDGHTASVFPHEIDLWNAESLCVVGTHPQSGQKRVSFTGHLINAAQRVVFLVTGEDKAPVVKDVVLRKGKHIEYPAALVDPIRGELEWYLDEQAASQLNL